MVVALRRIRLLTMVAPIVYIALVAAFSIWVLVPLFGNATDLRLGVIFILLVFAVVPFSLWVFSLLERQQRTIAETAAVLDSVHDYAIFMLDAAGRVVTWNPGAQQLKGYTSDEVIGQPVAMFYRAEDRAEDLPRRNLIAAAQQSKYEYEGWRRRKDGTRFWANVVSTSIRDENGRLLGFTQVVRDMSSRREVEERIQSLNEELELRVDDLRAANAEIAEHNRQLAAVNSAIGSIASALDLHHVLQNIADAARELAHSHYAALGVLDENGRIVEFITSGVSQEQREAIGPPPQGHGLLGVLIREGKALRIADIAADPRSSGFPPNHPPMTSLLGVPILFQDRAIGDLYLADKIGSEEFSREDEDLLMLLAGHAAVAIENARLYEDARKARDRLQAWSEELEKRVAERTREIARYSKELTTRVLQAQEEERKRIARELHDDTAQSLSTLMITLDLYEPLIEPDNETLRAGLNRVRELIRRTLDNVRALSHDLRPTILDDFGLVAALQWLGTEYGRTFGVRIDVDIADSEVRLPPHVELALFRIAQEALTNSAKYANPERIGISLTIDDAEARLIVADDGQGFDVDKVHGPTREGGLGLYGMRERADLLGGKLSIQSTPGHGTRVAVTVPLTGTREGLATAGTGI